MRTLLLAPAVLIALAIPATASATDPLICVDPGPTHIGEIVIDLPEVCVL